MASAPLSDPSARDLFAPDPGSGRKTLADRETAELVIGLVGPIGSGVSTAGGVIADVLETLFGYQTEHIDVSAVIEAAAPLVGDGLEEATTKAERIRALQRIGSRSRAALSESYLAQKVVERIALDREQGGWFEDTGFARPRRKVFIVDSLKHPAEIELLRDVYGDAFWLFGVFAPNDLRARRLRGKWGGGVDIPLIMRIDEAEGVEHGQKVRETMERADFFLRNDETLEDLRRVVLRFLDLIFAVGIGTPTRDEAAMYTAVSAATGSACLSRQVGAAIYSASGELLAQGRNDVPRAGGGLYAFEDGEGDHRCYRWGDAQCHKDVQRDLLIAAVTDALKAEGVLARKARPEQVKAALERTRMRNLMEFSRSIHAEMDAIVSVAREGKGSLRGATLYSTTYPCHNCARHIVAAGITRVVYIEPYPKSLALDLHSDAITHDPQEAGGGVVFLQYEGVAPKNIVRLFRQIAERKEDGRLIQRPRRSAQPVVRVPLDGFGTREQIVVERLASDESRLRDADTSAERP